MDLSDPDDMANRLKTWVEKSGETTEGKAALEKAGLYINLESEEVCFYLVLEPREDEDHTADSYIGQSAQCRHG
jgi:hypothetical protein